MLILVLHFQLQNDAVFWFICFGNLASYIFRMRWEYSKVTHERWQVVRDDL